MYARPMPMKYVMPDGRQVDHDAPEAVAQRLHNLRQSFNALAWFLIDKGVMTEADFETIRNEPELYDPSNPDSLLRPERGERE
jgi:hypothetical protein